MIAAAENSTQLIQRSIENPSRVLRNKLVDEILEMERKGTTLEELLPLIGGERARAAMATGDIDYGILACGQVVGLLEDVPTIKEVVDNVISGAEKICNQFKS
jgi:nitronate monooxygenase